MNFPSIVSWLTLFFIKISINSVKSQRIDCPNFKYINVNGQTVGEITIQTLDLNRPNRIDIRFSQRGAQPQSVVGELLPYPDEVTVIQQLGTNRPIYYRISLTRAIDGLLPKLTKLQVNGSPLCSSNDYGPPSSYFNRFSTLYFSSEQTIEYSGANIYSDSNIDSYGSVKNVFNQIGGNRNQDVDVRIIEHSNHFVPVLQQLAPAPIFPTKPKTPSPTPPPPPPPPPPPSLPRQRQNTKTTFTNAPIGDSYEPTAATNTGYSCGIESRTIGRFIHGGRRIERGRHPWLAAIFHKVSIGSLDFKCGGSLVSERLVITAAHCAFDEDDELARMVVSLGRNNLEDFSEEGSKPFDITNIAVHPEYDRTRFPDADIAILTLKTTVVYSQYIAPICVWTETDTVVANEGETAYVAGWGGDETGKETTSYPKEVSARIVDDGTCKMNADSMFMTLTSPRTVCAGNRDGTGPCMGDSGGGLMLNRNDRWILRGTVSAGTRTGRKCDLSQYVIFCDLSKHMQWIRERME